MKKTLVTFLTITTITSFNAQIFSENFTTPQSWQVSDLDGDSQSWEISDLSGGDLYLAAQGNAAGSYSKDPVTQLPLTPNNLFISPLIDLSTVIGNVYLTFKVTNPNITYFADYYSVYVLSDLTQLSTAIPVFSESLTSGGAWFTKNISLPGVVGESAVYIVFRHHDCSDEFLLLIDDIVVYQTSVSVEEYLLESNIYLNENQLFVTIYDNNTSGDISIVNMMGQTLETISHNGNYGVYDLNHLPLGIYLVNVTSPEGKSAVQKITIK